MFTRILLPLDGTSRGEEALPFARALALADSAQIFLLHVAPASAPASERAAHERRLEAIAKDLRGDGIGTHILTLEGQTPATIAAVAAVHKIDLIALAPESRGLLETLWRPSVTAGVLARTAAPVLIAPTADSSGAPPALLAERAAQVIVPLDGSLLAEKALPVARRLAERYERGLLLFRVIPPLQVIAAGPGTYPLLRDETDLEIREARQYLSDVREMLAKAGHVPVEYMLGHGIPANEILALAETKPGGMLVMSTHGRGDLARFVLGSVALAVARKATLPLLIVPAGEPHSQPRADATAATEAGSAPLTELEH